MRKTVSRIRLCAALLVLNVVFIWGNSLLPGSVSAAISGWIEDILASIFQFGAGDPNAGHGLLRKLAHFTEFACLGALFAWLYGMLQKPVYLALACGFAAACVDETIQCFVPNRGPSFSDVMIDTSGVLLGIGIVLLGYHNYKKKKSRTILEET